MLLALLVPWIVVSLLVAVSVSRLGRTRRELERVLDVDGEFLVVGRRLDARAGREVVLDGDGARTTISIEELLDAPRHRARPPAPPRPRASHEVARMES